MNEKRSVLTLAGKNRDVEEDSELEVPITILDLLLPARRFRVHYKVAEVGQVSLTTEFLLRLVFSVDGISENNVAEFFGFDGDEMAFVLKDPEAKGFVRRERGRLYLTDAGYALFNDDQTRPQIYEVIKNQKVVGFDLISLALCERAGLSSFERALPELGIRNSDYVANTSKYVPERFRHFFGEINSKKSKELKDGVNRSLYSVDDVVSDERFFALVPVVVKANIRRPGEPEANLEGWMSAQDLSNRPEIFHSAAEFLDNLKVPRREEDNNAFDLLLQLAPEYLKEFETRKGFNASKFFKDIGRRAGEVRRDRITIGIVGSLYLPENTKRIISAIGHSNNRIEGEDNSYLWVYPGQNFWGASRALEGLSETLKSEGVVQVNQNELKERDPLVIGCGKPPRHLKKHFDRIFDRPDNGSIPSSLEIMLIPQRFAAITVNTSVPETRGYPVPLGFISFDPAVVRRVHQYLSENLPKTLSEFGGKRNVDISKLLSWPEIIESENDAEDGLKSVDD